MPAKPKNKWSDVQTAIATAAIVTTLGMWNIFATPDQSGAVQAKGQDPVLPPQSPTESAAGATRPHVKIMFTQVASQTTTTVQQPQQSPTQKKKRDKNGSGGGGGAVSVTQTKSS
jgi:hypothetical protein